MTEFQREDRYIVIKRSDITAEQLAAMTDVPTRDCVVIERDWPEYEPVWAMIEARCLEQGKMIEICDHCDGSGEGVAYTICGKCGGSGGIDRAALTPTTGDKPRCDCFGDTDLCASTHTGADGERCCDLCGRPITSDKETGQ